MKVALFGARGFVGEYIIEEVLNSNFSPYILLRYGSESKIKRLVPIGWLSGHNSSAVAGSFTVSLIFSLNLFGQVFFVLDPYFSEPGVG